MAILYITGGVCGLLFAIYMFVSRKNSPPLLWENTYTIDRNNVIYSKNGNVLTTKCNYSASASEMAKLIRVTYGGIVWVERDELKCLPNMFYNRASGYIDLPSSSGFYRVNFIFI